MTGLLLQLLYQIITPKCTRFPDLLYNVRSPGWRLIIQIYGSVHACLVTIIIARPPGGSVSLIECSMCNEFSISHRFMLP